MLSQEVEEQLAERLVQRIEETNIFPVASEVFLMEILLI